MAALCVFTGKGLRLRLIIPPEGSYRVCVSNCV
jgi:hypothetical protein